MGQDDWDRIGATPQGKQGQKGSALAKYKPPKNIHQYFNRFIGSLGIAEGLHRNCTGTANESCGGFELKRRSKLLRTDVLGWRR